MADSIDNRYIIKYDMKSRAIVNAKFMQGDTDTGVLEVHLSDTSLVEDITGEAITFKFGKKDGTYVYQDITTGVTITDGLNGVVECVLMANTLSCPGIVLCEIHRELGAKKSGVPKFSFTVESSMDNGVLSSNYIASIETFLNNVKTVEAARVLSEGNRVIAENLRAEEFAIIKTDVTTGVALHANLQADITAGNTLKPILDASVVTADTSNTNLTETITTATTKKSDLDSSISAGTTLKTGLDSDISSGNILDTSLKTDISTGTTLDTTLKGDVSTGNALDTTLKEDINTGNTSHSTLQTDITAAKQNSFATEVTAGRGTYANLKARGDNVDSQLAHNVQQTSKNANDILAIDRGIGGTKADLATIQALPPDTLRYVNAANGLWYWHNGTSWVSGGTFQGIGIPKESIQGEDIKDFAVSIDKTDFGTGKYQFLDSLSWIANGYWDYGTSIKITTATTIHMTYYPKIRIDSGKTYTISQCRPYFSFLIYDDGTYDRVASTDASMNMTNVTITPTKSGYLHLSAIDNVVAYPINKAMVVNDISMPSIYSPQGNYGVKIQGLDLTIEDIAANGIGIANTDFLIEGKNKLNIALAEDGIWISGGIRRTDSSIFSVEQKIKPNTNYVLQGVDPLVSDEIWYDLYDAAKRVIASKVINYIGSTKQMHLNEQFLTPLNAETIAISSRLTSKHLLQLEEGLSVTSYEPYSLKIVGNELFKTIETVEYVEYNLYADGSGDFTNLRNAMLAITDANPMKIYTVYIHEGIYDVTTWYTVAEINALISGPTIKDYVNLVGVGNKEKVQLVARLSTSIYSADSAMAFSPLNLNSICEISNLTVIGQNTRYAIHDGANTSGLPARHVYNDVTTIKESGLGLANSYGAGSGDGAHYEYTNCQFISFSGTPFRLHNTHDQTIKAIYKFNNVKTINKSDNGYGMQFESEGSLTDDEIILIGVDSPSGITVILDNYGRTTLGWNVDGLNDYKSITGYGNTLSPNLITTLDSNNSYFDLNGEVIKGIAKTIITMGDAVIRQTNRTFVKMNPDDDISLFVGIALITVGIDQVVALQTQGYVPINRTNLPTTVGNKIGIVNGALSVVTVGDYIGIIEFTDFIKLK